ncbi:trypsin-like peptidase domain-containing protein [Erysipelotrichaceae bacterium 66-17]|nr:serine protease [Erysipelotrichaceae bacterium]
MNNKYNTTPPQFKKKSHTGLKAVGIIALAAVCGTAGTAGGYFGYQLASRNDQKPSVQIGQNNSSGHSSSIEAVDVSSVVDICRPSVVEITTETASSGNNPFAQYVQQGAGSGVIMSEDGYIITNNHVIEDASTIKVKTITGAEYDARLIGTDSQTDLAVIKVDATNLPPVQFGNSNDLKVGDIAIAIGNPLGSLGGTVTTGIISALDREITIENETMTLLQTDAAINPGNSGGGLFDASGNLIGIVNAKQSAAGIEGLGFAIPISDAVDILDELIQNGSVTSRPALNVSLYDHEETYRNSQYPTGVYVVQVLDGGAAQKAGIEVNDRIVSFDGQEVNSAAEVKALLRRHKIGDTVDIVIERNGQQKTVQVVLNQQTQ